ncbi:MAG: hypothetical protein ACLPWF_19885 [Bryobacteraceae bacterium]
MSKFTRRELAAALSTSAVLLGQVPPPPGDELKTSRDQLRDSADQLDKFPLPMTAEPATIFKP